MKLYSKISQSIMDTPHSLVALTGGGGKTTLLKKLSTYLKGEGLSVLITTSTKVQNPLFYDYEADYVFRCEKDVLLHDVRKGEKVFYAETGMDVKKVISPRLEVISLLQERYDAIIYEADGSRGLPIKIHSERDPVICAGTTHVFAVMGLDGVGERAYSMVFGDDRDIIVDSRYLSSYVSDPDGLLKGMDGSMENAILLNKADGNMEKIDEVRKVIFPYPCHICSEEKDEIYMSL